MVIWLGGTLTLPILFVGYLVWKRSDEFEGAFRRIFHRYTGVHYYTLLLYVVFAVSFGMILYGGWLLSQYLFHNEIISNTIASIILVGSLILAFPISFYLSVKVSDYLYLHGY